MSTSNSPESEVFHTGNTMTMSLLDLNDTEDDSANPAAHSIENAIATTSHPDVVRGSSDPSLMAQTSVKRPSSTPSRAGRSRRSKKPRFVIKKWSPIILWHWKIPEDNCAICKRELDGLCMYCIADSDEQTDCFLLTGKCGHAYHDHCMEFWLKKSPTCPLDNSEWEEKLTLSYGAYTDYDFNNGDAFGDDHSDALLTNYENDPNTFIDGITGEAFQYVD